MSQPDGELPNDTGAHGADARLVRPGGISYLHIPAADVRQAAAFYKNVFGWNVEGQGSDRPSFDDGTGHVSGAWVSDQAMSLEPGLLPYIYAEHVEETAKQIGLSSPFGGESSVRERDLDAGAAEVDHRDQRVGGVESVRAV